MIIGILSVHKILARFLHWSEQKQSNFSEEKNRENTNIIYSFIYSFI